MFLARRMKRRFARRGHEELLDVLLAHKGPYDSPLYLERLRHGHREEAVSYSQTASRKTEVLWMNFEPEEQMRMAGIG